MQIIYLICLSLVLVMFEMRFTVSSFTDNAQSILFHCKFECVESATFLNFVLLFLSKAFKKHDGNNTFPLIIHPK